MRSIIIFFALLSFHFVCGAQDNGISFQEGLNWSQVLARAKSENRYIFLDCYASWCGPCKAMDRSVYPDSVVGKYMNSRFISIKVQFDSTGSDDQYVQSWYKTVHRMEAEYKIYAYPSFMFFTPDGIPIHRGLGFKDKGSFLAMSAAALDTSLQYYTQLSNYKLGQRDYLKMRSLSIDARRFGDRELSKEIALEYNNNYIKNLSDVDLSNREIIDFMLSNPEMLKSSSRFFYLAYHHPIFLDSIYNGLSSIIVQNVIVSEEIDPYIKDKNGKHIGIVPDWEKMSESIKNKYSAEYAHRLILENKILYSEGRSDWDNYSKLVDEKVKLYPPKSEGGSGGDLTLLNRSAWKIFLKCSDPKLLSMALSWSNLTVKKGQDIDIDILASIIDTKANLLYKLGKRKEALACQREAIKVEERRSGKPLTKENNLEKNYLMMQKGLPTWTNQE